METQGNKFSHPLLWIAGIAITLFCAAGIAAIMGWIPTSMGGPNNETALSRVDKAPANSPKPAAARPRAAPAQVASSAPVPVKTKCAECGVVESTRAVEARGEGSGIGAAGGAVVGGLLGHQVGGGRGQDIATVVGAVGGAVAGNEIEKRVKTTKGYEVTVRMDDGASRVFAMAGAPSWRSGDRVKIVDGAIHAN